METVELFKRISSFIGHYSYVFIVSDNKEIRNFFEKEISLFENISVVDEEKDTDDKLEEELRGNNVLLINPEARIIRLNERSIYLKKHKEHLKTPIHEFLISDIEDFQDIQRSIVIVCDSKLVKLILEKNNLLCSVSCFYFLDNNLNNKKLYSDSEQVMGTDIKKKLMK